MRVIDLAFKDLTQILRERKMLLFMLLMPIVFTAFMGFAMSRPASTDDPRLPVGFVTQDQAGSLSQNLATLLQESKTIRPAPLTGDAAARATEQVRQGKLAAALIVPAGFSEKALAGETVKLTLIADETTTAGQTVRQAVQAIVVRVLSAAQIGRISVERIQAIQPFADEPARQAAWSEAVTQANAAWQKPTLTVAMEAARPAQSNQQSSLGFAQSSPGMIVMFAIFGLMTSASVLVVERKSKTLQRLLTTSLSRAGIIAGHLLAMFMLVLMQVALLVAVGQLGFGVDYAREPLAVLVVAVALALWVASLGLFIGAVTQTDDQAVLWSLIAMFVFSGLGGAWFPLEFTGGAFATVGHLMPSAWAMDGFQNIIVRGLGLNSVLLPAGILLVYAAGFFGLAVWRFRFE
jgi:ABC-2 type transport system permease protein